MPKNNDFNTYLIAKLKIDESTASIADLNKQIEELEKKVNSLKVKVEFDSDKLDILLKNIDKLKDVGVKLSNTGKSISGALNSSFTSSNANIVNATAEVQKYKDTMEDALEVVHRYNKNPLTGNLQKTSVTRIFEDPKGIKTKVTTDPSESDIYSKVVKDSSVKQALKEQIDSMKEYNQELMKHQKEVQQQLRLRAKELYSFEQDTQKKMEKEEIERRKKHLNRLLQIQREFNNNYNEVLKLHNKDVDLVNKQKEKEMNRQIQATVNEAKILIKKQAELDKMYNQTLTQHKKDVENVYKKEQKERIRTKGFGNRVLDFPDLFAFRGPDKEVSAEIDKTIKSLHGLDTNLKSLRKTFQGDKEVWRYVAAVKTGRDTFMEYSGAVDMATKSIYEHAPVMKNTLTRNLNMFEKIKVALSNIPTWMIGMTIFYGALRSFQNGLKEIAGIDKEMVNLKKVTDETAATYRKFAEDANIVGTNLGRTTSEVIKATAEFARLGYTLAEAKMLAKESIVFSVVGDIGVEEASKDLVSAIKGFGIEVDLQGKNIRNIVDIYNEVGNKFAISSAGIGEATRRSAASLKEAGNTIEESVAMVVGANSTLQDPAAVGTALKTVAMRIRGIDEEGEKVKNLVPELEASFKRLGLTILNSSGGFKSTYDIIKDLASVWDKLDDIERSDILEKVAGKRQGNVVASLINNWSDAEKALQVALNSSGSAAREHSAAMDSIEARMNKLSNTISGFWQSTIDSKGMKTMIEVVINLVEALKSLTDTIGITAFTLGTLSAGYALFNLDSSRFLSSALIDSISRFRNLSETMTLSIGVVRKSSDAMSALGNMSLMTSLRIRAAAFAIRFLGAALNALVLGGIFMAVGYGLEFIATKIREHNEKIEEENKLIKESVDKYNEHSEKIKELAKEYAYLSRTMSRNGLNTNEYEKFLSVQKQLGDVLPGVVEKIDEQGKTILKNSNYVQEYVANLEKTTDAQNKITISQFYIDEQVRLKKLLDLQNKVKQAKEEEERSFNTIHLSSGASIPSMPTTVEKDAQQRLIEQKDLLIAEKNLNDALQESSNLYTDIAMKQLMGVEVAKNLKKENIEYIRIQARKLIEEKKNSDNLIKDEVIIEKIKNQLLKLAEVNESMKEPVTYKILGKDPVNGLEILDTASRKIEIMKRTLEIAGVEVQEINRITEAYLNTLGKENILKVDLDEATKNLTSQTNDFISKHKNLAQTLDKLNKGEDINLETIISLTQEYRELLPFLEKENDRLVLNKEATDALARAKEREFKNKIKMLEEEAKQSKETTELFIKNKLAEIGVMVTLDQVRQGSLKNQIAIQNNLRKINGTSDNIDFGETFQFDIKSYEDLQKTYEESIKTLNDMQKATSAIESIDFTTMLGKEDDKKGRKNNDVLPYDLKDYEHLDRILANQLENLKYLKTPYEGKLEENAMKSVKDITDQQINKLNERINLAKEHLIIFQDEAAELYRGWEVTVDQEDKNEYGRKYDEKVKKIDDVTNSMRDWQEEIRKLTEITDKQAYKENEVKKVMEDLDDQVEISKGNLEGLKKESIEYRKELEKQNEIIDRKRTIVSGQLKQEEAELENLKKLLESGNLLESQQNELIQNIDKKEQSIRTLRKEYSKLTSDIYDNLASIKESNSEWLENTEKIADKIVDKVKESYEKMKDLSTKAIDETIKEEEKKHKKTMDMLDEEENKYESVINNRLKSLDDKSEEEDFNKDLSKAQKERADIQKKIDLLSMDNSIETQMRLSELKKELLAKDESIADMKEKRARELRKKGLQDELDSRKKDYEDKKKKENDKFEKTKEALEKSKQEIEKFYNDIIEDEERWSLMRKSILEGNTENVIKEINKISSEFQTLSEGDFNFLKEELGTYWETFEELASTNLAQLGISLKTYLSQATALKELITGTSGSVGGDLSGGLNQIDYGGKPKEIDKNKNIDTSEQRQTDRQKYLGNKMSWWHEYMTTGKTDTGKQVDIAKENEAFRQKYKNDPDFKDYNRMELAIVSGKFNEFMRDFREYIKNKLDWESSDANKKQLLNQRNIKLRDKWQKEGYPFPDFTLDQIKKMNLAQFRSGGYSGDWSGGHGKLAVLHSSEQIFNKKDTLNLLNAAKLLRPEVTKVETKNGGDNSSNNVTINKVEVVVDGNRDGKEMAKEFYTGLMDGLRSKFGMG